MKPNTFVIGAPKCGTTALCHYLSDHPEVFFSKPKEPFYWANDLISAPHELRPENLDAYLDLFSRADPTAHHVVAEGSTSYLRSKTAIRRILDFNPEAKFIVLLRNPVEVAHAYHMEQIYAQHESELDFATAWRLQDKREKGLCLPERSKKGDFVLYRRVASFADQINSLFNEVPEAQRRVIVFDDFIEDTEAVYGEVLSFLGLSEDGRKIFPAVNGSHQQRFPWLAKILLYPPKPFEMYVKRLRFLMLKNQIPGISFLKGMLNKPKARQVLPEHIKKEVFSYFEMDINRLEILLQRDLSNWRY